MKIKIFYYRVFHLSADLVEGKTLDEVGVMASTDNAEPLMLNVLLGGVQILASDDITLSPQPVTNIYCDEVIVDKISSMSQQRPEDYTDKCISMRLLWNEPDIAADVSAYHIW